MSKASHEFTPVMPHPLALPWPGWEGVTVIYDLYACERFIDEQAGVLAESRAARRALAGQALEIDAQPEGAARLAAVNAWTDAYNAWLRAHNLTQLAFFVLRVEFPTGQQGPGDQPNTWHRVPTRFLTWICNEGFEAARAALWSEPDPKGPASSPSATPSTAPLPADASTPA